VTKLGWKTDAEVLTFVASLKHNEHIDAPASCGNLRPSFSIQLGDMGGWPVLEEKAYYAEVEKAWHSARLPEQPRRPFTYRPTENNAFVAGHECFIRCEAQPHNSDCVRSSRRGPSKAFTLETQLTRAAEMPPASACKEGSTWRPTSWTPTWTCPTRQPRSNPRIPAPSIGRSDTPPSLDLSRSATKDVTVITLDERLEKLLAIQRRCRQAQTPLQREPNPPNSARRRVGRLDAET
jgi:hypothetical protein